jgi:hypothetical protein
MDMSKFTGGPSSWQEAPSRSFDFQNVNSESMKLASGVIQVQTGPNPLWMLTWHASVAPTCGAHMSVGYISAYFYFFF